METKKSHLTSQTGFNALRGGSLLLALFCNKKASRITSKGLSTGDDCIVEPVRLSSSAIHITFHPFVNVTVESIISQK